MIKALFYFVDRTTELLDESIVIFSHIKHLLSTFNCKLCEYCNRPKAGHVLRCRMMEILQPLVDCPVSHTKLSPHLALISMTRNCTRNFARCRALCCISIVGFYSLSRPKHAFQTMSEDHQIIPLSRQIRTSNPDNIRRPNRHSNFVSECRQLNLIRVQLRVIPTICKYMAGNWTICAIDQGQTIITNIVVEPILPQNL
jgi:hypothetical protein